MQVSRHAPGSRFVTLFLGALRSRDRRVSTYVNAGQTPPLLRRVNGAIERLTRGRRGARHVRALDATRPGQRRLGPGDVLVFYSDGITEAENKAGEPFDDAGLSDVINRHWWEDAATIGTAIVSAVQAHADRHAAGRRPHGAGDPPTDSPPGTGQSEHLTGGAPHHDGPQCATRAGPDLQLAAMTSTPTGRTWRPSPREE